MSLVAYGSSDESGDSDAEESNQVVVKPKATDFAENGLVTKLSDNPKVEIDQIPGPVAPSKLAANNDTNGIASADGSPAVDALLHGLPAPKGLSSTVIDENDELEDEVKPKSSQVSDIQKPPTKKKQPVRITIPKLRYDSDDDEPTVKKVKPTPAAGKTGLAALLPPPVHAAKKESNRILLPYTLKRKPTPVTSKPAASPKSQTATISNLDKMAKLQTLNMYDSDSDEHDSEPVNFFSLDSTVKNSSSHGNTLAITTAYTPDSSSTESTVALPPQLSRTALHLPPPVSSAKTSEPSLLPVESSDNVSHKCESTDAISQKPSVNFDAPLTFKGGISSKKPEYAMQTQSYAEAAASYSGDDEEGGDKNMYYNQLYEETSHYVEATDDQALQQDRSFLRIQGKKRRGREDIKIMDVVADDFTTPDELAKTISEEQQYPSHRKKDNMPSGQQKRKHQITYLAFQAKETELELKNQWADNRMTKKQTQAKYGF